MSDLELAARDYDSCEWRLGDVVIKFEHKGGLAAWRIIGTERTRMPPNTLCFCDPRREEALTRYIRGARSWTAGKTIEHNL